MPANSSVDIALDFEAAPGAVVVVLADQIGTGLSAAFGGTSFQVAEMLGVPILVADLDNPLNGPLHVTNATGTALDVGVLVAPKSARRMTATVAPSLVAPDQATTITASLSAPDPGDAPRARVSYADVVVADLALSLSGDGSWKASFTPPHSGAYLVVTSVDGLRPRRATAVFTVGTGGASLTGTFTEQVPDDNGNGLADALVVRPAVSVTSPGPYRISGKLVDATGAVVTAAGSRATLAAGAQAMDMRFDGPEVFQSQRSGPYTLVDVVLSHDDEAGDLEAEVARMGPTGPYDFRQFETSRS